MTTIALLRTNHLNKFLGITVDADTIPWTSADRDSYLTDALVQSWPDIGKRGSGTVATNQNSDVYTVPVVGGVSLRVSRIEVEQTAGAVTGRIDRVVKWRPYSDTQVRISPMLATVAGFNLRFFGWVPFLADATDLPARLDPVIAYRAAAIAFGAGAGQQGNYKRQQGLDEARVTDYATLVGLSAYWERRYFEAIAKDPARLSYAPRSGRR